MCVSVVEELHEIFAHLFLANVLDTVDQFQPFENYFLDPLDEGQIVVSLGCRLDVNKNYFLESFNLGR